MKKRRKRRKGERAKARRVLKSAVSGRFVSKTFAKKHPRTTYAERVDLSKHRSQHPEA